MIKATLHDSNGKTVVMLGLSFGNLDKFRQEPMNTFIRIDGKEMGIPVDILLFSGETEAHMQEHMMEFIRPDTIVHIDPKLKS